MLKLRNPFIMAPVKLGYSDGKGNITERHIKFYDIRSKYVGAVIPEPLYIDQGLRELPTQIGIDDDNKIEGLKNLVDIFHKNGAKAIAHLNHPGRMANPKIPGNYFVSSVDKACEAGGKTPIKMTKTDMEKAKNLIVNAAMRAEKAGFDAIELQYGHGYLMAQFISPTINNRTDEYGGSFENRMRFPLEVLQAVKNAVNIPIIIRISGDEMYPNGLTLSEIIKVVKELKNNGAEIAHVLAGSICNTPPWFFQHMFTQKGKTWELASQIKKETDMPVIAVGQINSFDDIDKLKNEYKVDYIAIGRALVADPFFVAKYLGEIDGIPRPCLACSDGCLGGVKSGKGLGCVVNPLVGKNDDFTLTESSKKHKYAIIGGGLAGMEAALTLHKKGNKVTIFEENELGGQFNLASLPPKKSSLANLVKYYMAEIKNNDIKVVKEKANTDKILDDGFDKVIIATGSKPIVPPIEGLKDYMWAEVLEKKNLIKNKKVVIIGGGLIGTEIAHTLLKQDNEVIIVEMLSEIARGMEAIEKALTLKSFQEANIKIYTETKVTKIDANKVHIEGKETGVIENVDQIILSAGMKSNDDNLYEQLKDKLPVYVIGDAKQVGKAQDAIRDAFETVMNL